MFLNICQHLHHLLPSVSVLCATEVKLHQLMQPQLVILVITEDIITSSSSMSSVLARSFHLPARRWSSSIRVSQMSGERFTGAATKRIRLV